MKAYRIHLALESGGSVACEPLGVEPLGFDDLLVAGRREGGSVPLAFEADDAIIDGNIVPGRSTLEARVDFRHPPTVYALVDGGWLPPPLVLSNRFIVDRNVVSTLAVLNKESHRHDSEAFGWWMNLLEHGWFNPLPYALEGSRRATPSYEEFVADFERGRAEIRAALPESKVVAFEEMHFRAAYEQTLALLNRRSREATFLLRIAPAMTDRLATPRLRNVEDLVVEAAGVNRLAGQSLAVIVALSCVYEDAHGGYSVGRSVLKPRPGYAHEDAYNALADLNQLELLVASHVLELEAPLSLCTRDRALALLWCALAPRNIEYLDPGIRWSMSLDRRLFPRLDAAGLTRLRERLTNLTARGGAN